MTWLLSSTGREYPLGAHQGSATAPSLTEIGWSLAHINRYTGHARRAYSVAEHSLLVADIAHAQGASKIAELVCLMHDAHECIVGDMASPVKEMVGPAWDDFERTHQARLLDAYNLTEHFHTRRSFVKHCDLIALATERRDLLPHHAAHNTPWPAIDTPGAEIPPWPDAALMQPGHVLPTPAQWCTRFIARAEHLLCAALTSQHTQAAA